MSGVELGTGLRAYGRLLQHGPAARPLLSGAVARLTLAMIPLGILILVEQQRQAYAIAGIVTGAYAVGAALGTPLWGRLMDRVGQVAVLLPTSAVSVGLLVTLALDHLAPAHRLNEAQAFLSASNTIGAAVGTAIAGIVIDLAGVAWSSAGAAGGVMLAAGIAVLHQSRWRRASVAVSGVVAESRRR